MPRINVLQMECSKCKVANFCDKKGASPLKLSGNTKVLCRLIGGYGRVPVDQTILGEESSRAAEKNGSCMTIAEVPFIDESSGGVVFKVEKVFSPPILHEREKVGPAMDITIPKAPG